MMIMAQGNIDKNDIMGLNGGRADPQDGIERDPAPEDGWIANAAPVHDNTRNSRR